ncbi:MAG: bifunctional diaminohydroxyphosphoribosylaminopyrimidine deaminase/5-amino-6-(5-phosphoribosylamino)uracil reductase RibD [Phycisphaerales bacterium]|jgi:diaminohydroxyphosphoribosylaminopyrimidine deaminase/5-amino-6-(5-phosphoribosylamino)uracil reductase|nr:bifunctional diaminohydroxyphosphoribosylaminopyrimidine deaminase/5-amino-6-(5-phosphoribosylamino)uracil reductase RibD [Phycisphaerales bacterium]
MSKQIHDHDLMMLERAARRALRGHGEAEPNPSVGCVIADANGRVVGEGRTRHPGGPHAEIEAIRAAADAARGGTAWVTLEPCNHHGKTPPCVDAIIAAGIARVVVGSPESNEFASGGMARLREAGIEVVLRPDVDSVRRLHASFHGRVSTGLPWVIAKWAETHDGALSTPPGASPWISGPRSIRLVHRERGRSDAILTGIGTILADDPRLDARQVRRRRTPMRVIVDPDLDTPPTALILKTKEGPVLIACRDDDDDEHRARSERLTAAGATILPIEDPRTTDTRGSDSRNLRGRFSAGRLRSLLHRLAEDHDVATVLTECGAGLLQSLFEANLIDAALVFTAPETGVEAKPAAPRPRDLLQLASFETIWSGLRGDDRVVWSQRRT